MANMATSSRSDVLFGAWQIRRDVAGLSRGQRLSMTSLPGSPRAHRSSVNSIFRVDPPSEERNFGIPRTWSAQRFVY